jgi:hypothetical protein
LDVFGTRAFFATRFVERHLLTFTEVIEVHAFNAGRVKEQVLRATNVNETETFVGETFDRTFCHFSIYSKEFLVADAGDEVVLALSTAAGIVSDVAPLPGTNRLAFFNSLEILGEQLA